MVNADNYYQSNDQYHKSSNTEDFIKAVFVLAMIIATIASIFGWIEPNSICGRRDSVGDMVDDCSEEMDDEYQLEQLRERNSL